MHITSIVHMSLPSALREQKALSVHSLRSGDNRAVCQFRAEVELGTHIRATIFCGQFHQIDRELKGKNDLKTTLLYYSPFVPLPFVHKVFNYAAFHRLYSPGWFVYNPSRRLDTRQPTATVLIFCRQFRQMLTSIWCTAADQILNLEGHQTAVGVVWNIRGGRRGNI
jgi:hypothetical protein